MIFWSSKKVERLALLASNNLYWRGSIACPSCGLMFQVSQQITGIGIDSGLDFAD